MTYLKNKPLVFITTILILFFSTIFVYAYSSGIAGRTKKVETTGCAPCHGANTTPDVTLTWIVPDSIPAGSSAVFSLIINKPSKTGAGFDVASRIGTLDTAMPLTKMLNGEVVHSQNIPMVNGTSAILFRYNAPGTPQVDTLYATALATNSNGSSSGDDWNWAVNKPIRITAPIGIEQNSNAVRFQLNQNYPNPFNPSTTITFEISKSTNVKLVVYDILGNEVETILNERMGEGQHSVVWNPAGSNSVSSGIYFYKLFTDNGQDMRKMMLLK